MFDFKQGELLLIDKAKDWTSFDVVAKVRNLIKRFTGEKVKVGHAGTLDPMATGLLILATGKQTKRLNELQNLDKQYIAEITLGATTPSYDAETEIEKIFPKEHITEEKVKEVLKNFVGKQKQMPPAYSAKKIKGKKAYELARKGKEVNLQEVEIEIKNIEIVSLNLPDTITIKVDCSKGTYIRSLAHDIGKALDSGGYLTYLRRTKIGHYKVEESVSIEQFEEILKTMFNH